MPIQDKFHQSFHYNCLGFHNPIITLLPFFIEMLQYDWLWSGHMIIKGIRNKYFHAMQHFVKIGIDSHSHNLHRFVEMDMNKISLVDE
jgi:hypothetical protein